MIMMRFLFGLFALTMTMTLTTSPASSQQPPMAWKTSWVGSVQGPYPIGNPSVQPDQRFAFPTPATGAEDQSFRLILRPTLWGKQARLRLSNALGTKPVTFASAHVGLQMGAAALVPATNRPVLFAGKATVTVAPGASIWSDPVDLAIDDPASPMLVGRKLAVSFHVVGDSGPMTWHAKALQTSYVSAPKSGDKAAEESEASFPYATASWFFLDALDVMAPATTPVVVGFGDSITDGTASVMNGDDRWPDILARRLALAFGPNRVAVLNAGIGGNQVAGPAEYSPAKPFAGGPSSVQRLERDVLTLSGVTSFIWLEGINDFSKNGGASAEAVERGMRDGVARLRAGVPGVRVIGATVTSALGSTSAAHGFAEQDEKRKALNQFIRSSGVFDAVVDFDAAVLDPATGGMKPEFIPESTAGGVGDKLHPNRTGYHVMAHAIDPAAILPGLKR